MTTSRRTLLGTALVLTTLASAATSSAPQSLDLRPGLWETKLERELHGKTLSAQTEKECLTASDLKEYGDLKGFVTMVALLGQETCTVADYRTEGARTRFNAACKGDSPARVAVEANVAAEAYSIVSDVKAGDGNTYRVKLSGRRLGACAG